MSSHSGKVAWNTGIQLLGKVITTGLGLAITIFLTRYLGPKGYGDYTFVLVFVMMFGSIADWGLYLVGINEVSKNPEKEGLIAGNILTLRLVLAFLAAILANIVIRVLPHSPSMEGLILIGSVFIVLFSLKTSFQIVFNAKLRMEFWAISELAANVLGLVLVLYLITQDSGISGFIWAMNLGQVASLALAMFFAFKLVKWKFGFDKEIMARVVKAALPVGSLLVLFTVYNRLDIVILGYMKGAEAVGFYGASYKVYDVLVLGAAYFANSVLPILSNLAHKDQARFRQIYVKSFVVLLGMGVTVAILNFIFAPLAILILGGPEFQPSVLALRILSLAIVVSYFNHLNGYAIIALGKQWYSFIIAILALGANLALNLLLIPRFSLYGAAFNTFLTEGTIMILSVIILRKTENVRFGPRDLFLTGKELFEKRGEYLKNLKLKP